MSEDGCSVTSALFPTVLAFPMAIADGFATIDWE
jgi:hypothetical protein